MQLRKCLGGVLCLAVLACGQAASPTAASPAQKEKPVPASRIRLMDMQRVILTCNEGKKSSDALRERFAARNTDLERRLAELQELQKAYSGTPANLTDRRNELAMTIDRKSKSLQRDKDDFTAEVQQAENELIDSIGKKVLKVVDDHARKQGYDLILETSQQGSTILWFPKTMDITEEVVAAVNAAPPARAASADKPANVAAAPKRP